VPVRWRADSCGELHLEQQPVHALGAHPQPADPADEPSSLDGTDRLPGSWDRSTHQQRMAPRGC
jgi:hypothetical protein